MPTGYTHIVDDGCTFEEYAWRCARGMMALVSMRDMPADAPIPEKLEVGDYDFKYMEEIAGELSKIEAMSIEDAASFIEEENKRIIEKNKDAVDKDKLIKQRYQDMKKKVREWEPPTSEHEDMKYFMLSQLDTGCPRGEAYQYDLLDIHPNVWIENKKKELLKDYEHHKKQHEKEVMVKEERNQWLAALRESIPQPQKGAD